MCVLVSELCLRLWSRRSRGVLHTFFAPFLKPTLSIPKRWQKMETENQLHWKNTEKRKKLRKISEEWPWKTSNTYLSRPVFPFSIQVLFSKPKFTVTILTIIPQSCDAYHRVELFFFVGSISRYYSVQCVWDQSCHICPVRNTAFDGLTDSTQGIIRLTVDG